MKIIYKESIGQAKITLYERDNNGGYIVVLLDNHMGIHRAENYANYEDAIAWYDGTCNQASKIYNVARELPDKPDFVGAINI
jgi:hypothetical protein